MIMDQSIAQLNRCRQPGNWLISMASIATWSGIFYFLVSFAVASASTNDPVDTYFSWEILINTLKIGGILTASVAAVVSILSDTREPDTKKLSFSGKMLLATAILGSSLALGSQLLEWIQADREAQAARQRTERILAGIQRAVTRIDSVTVDASAFLPLDDPRVKEYADDLRNRIERAKDVKDLRQNQIIEGLTATVDSDHHLRFLTIESGSIALPREGFAGEYIISAIPYIDIFRIPIDPKMFRSIRQYSSDLLGDLILSLLPTAPISNAISVTDSKINHVLFVRRNMMAQIEYANGRIMSIKDLEGAQAIIYLRGEIYEKFGDLWRYAKPEFMRIQINGVDLSLHSQDLRMVETNSGETVYEYRFPTKLLD